VVFLSTNSGTSWTSVNTGLEDTLDGGTVINALAVKDSNLFAATQPRGVVLSTDWGGSWRAANAGLPGSYYVVNALAVRGTIIFAALHNWEGGKGVYRSTDNGANWSAASTGLGSRFVSAISVNGMDLFAGTYEAGVFRSSDDGTSWSAINDGLPPCIVSAFAVSGTSVFAGTNEGQGGSVYLTTNNGTSWNAAIPADAALVWQRSPSPTGGAARISRGTRAPACGVVRSLRW
jgi:photosystem II stability/assembly factor-like uncharacterized protein